MRKSIDEELAVALKNETVSCNYTEPYNVEYVSNRPYVIPDLAAGEKWFIRKVSIILNKLRREHIPFEYDNDYGVFAVSKYRYTIDGNRRNKKGKLLAPKKVYSKYPTYMYIGVYDDGQYNFGGEYEDLIVSTRISDVIKVVKEWLSNNEPAVK